MNFQEIHMYTDDVIFVTIFAAGLFVGIPLLVGIASVIGDILDKDASKRQRIALAPMFLLGAMLVVGVFQGHAMYQKISPQNDAALISNLNQKYDVDEIKLDAYDTYTLSNMVQDQKIHVAVDGNTYMFYLSQNQETWEPTLIDPPINGGNAQDMPVIKVEDILK